MVLNVTNEDESMKKRTVLKSGERECTLIQDSKATCPQSMPGKLC